MPWRRLLATIRATFGPGIRISRVVAAISAIIFSRIYLLLVFFQY
jgi:hypothetical protein